MSSNVLNSVEVIQDKRMYLGIIVIGYFAIKIMRGFFGYNEKLNKDEMFDFTSVIVMSMLLYYFTNFSRKNPLNGIYLLGFFVGVIFSPMIGYLDKMAITGIHYIFYALVIIIVIIMMLLSFRSSSNPIYYGLYLIVIVLILLGLIMTRKKKVLTLSSTEEVIESSGSEINMNIGIIAWLLGLIFLYQGDGGIMTDIIMGVNGLVIGVFVGYVSLNGISYILVDGEKNVKPLNLCVEGKIEGKEYTNLTQAYDTLKWVSTLTLMLVIIMIILMFMMRGS